MVELAGCLLQPELAPRGRAVGEVLVSWLLVGRATMVQDGHDCPSSSFQVTSVLTNCFAVVYLQKDVQLKNEIQEELMNGIFWQQDRTSQMHTVGGQTRHHF